MRVEIADNFKDFHKIIYNFTSSILYVDVRHDFMFISNNDVESNMMAIRLHDRTNNMSLADIDRVIKSVTLLIKNRTLIGFDLKETFKALKIKDPIEKIEDIKIRLNLQNRINLIRRFEMLDNYCDFETYVQSRAKMHELFIKEYYFY